MKILLSLTLSHLDQASHRTALVDPAKATIVSLRSPFLVSAGQTLDVRVVASPVEVPTSEPGDRLIDARQVSRVVLDHTHDYRWIPSDRPLWAILEDIVQHGIDNPKHGIDCVCMDQYSYELKRHVSKALPVAEERDWESTYDARFRIQHVLRRVGNVL